MRNAVLLFLSLVFVASVAVGQKKGKVVTIVGEVVETQCYVTGATGPGKGQEHKDCALTCAKNGIPLSILEEKTGTLYLAGQTKTSMSGANKMLLDYVAEKVTVRGRLFEKGGMKLQLIDSVTKVSEK